MQAQINSVGIYSNKNIAVIKVKFSTSGQAVKTSDPCAVARVM
jgi:hypothetical protein